MRGAQEAVGDIFDRIRAAAAEVARRARSVRIDESKLTALARELSGELEQPSLDPAHHRLGDRDATLAYVLTLDAINFGSGWFPRLEKRPGLSGYLTLATALREHFEREGPFSATALRALSADECAAVLGQDLADPDAAELMGLFARALSDLGAFLEDGWRGRFDGPVVEADGSAARLVTLLTRMPLYRDVSGYDELTVPFYKRAQITVADLSAAFERKGPGRFHDLDRLTLFADNLVPHVLRREGVLVYAPDLGSRIDAGELLEAGSPEEVEIRAVAVHAVERCVAEVQRAGGSVTAAQLDTVLWNRGQRPGVKAHPRHRARCTWY